MTTIICDPTLISARLEYDPAKDAANIAKHGLSLADAWLVYDAPEKITLRAYRRGEDRLVDVAMVEVAGVVLVLVYVVRGEVLRAISLRRASKAERRFYEQARQD